MTTIPNSIAVVNGKGGVLKTTTVSHVAAIAAEAGWKVLVVDADSQANLSRDLGYVPDGGVGLAAALLGTAPLEPLTSEGRPNLDYIAGGDALTAAASELQHRLSTGNVGAFRAFEAALAPIATNYNLVLIDSGPGDVVLRKMILAAAHYVVVPSKTDTTSIPDGLANLFRTIGEVRTDANPELEVLGVTLGPVRPSETRRLAQARARAIEVLGGDETLVFGTSIRDNGKIADDCRNLGIVATEYERRAEQEAATKTPWYKRTKADRDAAKSELAFSAPASAAGLAQDWQNLADEILGRYAERQAELAA